MIFGIVLQFVIMVLLLGCSAFFSSAELAFFSLDPLDIRRIKATTPLRGEMIQNLLHQPRRLLSSILIGNTLVNILATGTGHHLAEQLVGPQAALITVPTMFFLLLVFGEIGPKRLAVFFPDRLSMLYAPPLQICVVAATPVRIMLEGISHVLKPLFASASLELDADEFETVVELSAESGVLDAHEEHMVHAVLRLRDLQVADVMTPRVDLVGVDLDEPDTLLENVRRARVRYLPMYRDDIDRVEGFLDVNRYLLDPLHEIDEARLPVVFVPELAALDKVLTLFLSQQNRVAMVVDEYGGTAGLVTRGDVVEEITGDLEDEHAEVSPLLEELSPTRYMVDASISLEELNRRLHLDLEAEGADRLSGWVMAQAEYLPRPGHRIEAQGVRVTVRHRRKNRITLVLLEWDAPVEEDS